MLCEAGLSFQRTRSWKASPDPDYAAKADWVLSLYERAPKGGAVICFDQMGPISLRPTHGAGWAPLGRPERHRATFNRRHGTRYVLGAHDVHADYLRTRLRPRRTGAENLRFMRSIRDCYPRRLRLFWIQDNFSANWTPDIRGYAADSNIEFVPHPPTPATSTGSSATSARSRSSSWTTPTTSTGKPRASRSPATSATATDPPQPETRRRQTKRLIAA